MKSRRDGRADTLPLPNPLSGGTLSIQAMSWVLEFSKSRHAARLVLISIANHCSVMGDNAWPAVATIAREANISERQVQYALKELEEIGELSFVDGTGRGQTHKFSLPAFQQWVQTLHPLEKRVQSSHKRVQSTTVKGEQTAPEPSLTVNEPSKDKTILLQQFPEWLPVAAWNSYLEMRRKIRKPLFADRGIGLAIKRLEKLRQAGHDPEKVLDQSILNCWQGLFEVKEVKNGQQESFEERRRRKSEEAISAVGDRARKVLQEMERGLPNSRGD